MTNKPKSIIDIIRASAPADRHKILNEIAAAAPHLPLQDLKALNAALSAEVKNQEVRNSAKGQRLARLSAAAESDDPVIADARRIVSSGLKRLGMGEINAHAASGISVAELDQKMRDRKWGDHERIMVKAAAHRLGLVE